MKKTFWIQPGFVQQADVEALRDVPVQQEPRVCRCWLRKVSLMSVFAALFYGWLLWNMIYVMR